MTKSSSLLAITLAASALMALAGPALAYNKPTYPERPRVPVSAPSTYSCANELGHLRRVYEDQLDFVTDSQDVSIVPVCLGEDYGVMRNDGNAGALRQHIAYNDAMLEALAAANFLSDDVVGVRMTGDDSVILYVHTFFYR
jgi:hypothetical protein